MKQFIYRKTIIICLFSKFSILMLPKACPPAKKKLILYPARYAVISAFTYQIRKNAIPVKIQADSQIHVMGRIETCSSR